MITDAPWFIRNKNILHDLKVPTIKDFFSKLAINFFNQIDNHSNPAIRSIPTYDPSINRKKRRPRTLLLQDKDKLFSLVEALFVKGGRPISPSFQLSFVLPFIGMPSTSRDQRNNSPCSLLHSLSPALASNLWVVTRQEGEEVNPPSSSR
ncbi:hypothetical protein AVEN_112322-1 [Araneus ventricosus]|uniref:Uncharacterized protein n=1 Tax=Araneus ventricosus TaxID=182803 RepID=A0A4Y2SLA9_ARAVE|nr:hypothetical protein AVEN_112322-1 [Araneus ventricosus]